MTTELVHIGFGHLLAMNRVVAMVTPGSAPIRRLVQESKGRGVAIDMTGGRRTKAVIFLDTGQIVLAPITPETIAHRLAAARGGATGEKRLDNPGGDLDGEQSQ